MGDPVQPFGGGGAEDVAEELRWVADFGGNETDADEVLPVGQSGAQRPHRILRPPVPQEAHDQVRGHVVRRLSLGQRG